MIKLGLILTAICACACASPGPSPHRRDCYLNYKPVCGTNGVTYANDCFFIYAQEEARAEGRYLEIRHAGECAVGPDCFCVPDARPVCGTDHKTYRNACELGCAMRVDRRLRKGYNGECGGGSAAKCLCPMIYAPVCGSNGQTYPNGCTLYCDAKSGNGYLVKIADGPCRVNVN